MHTAQQHHRNSPVWYLLQCKVQQHARAMLNLDNQDFTVFSPEHSVRRITRGQIRTRVEPLFPGYVFIQLDDFTDWRALQSTRGVSHVVSFNGRPQPVSEALISALKARFAQPHEPAPLYKRGEKVMITQGAFRHVEAIVKAVTSDERIIVLLNILHTQQSLTVPMAQLQKVS